MNQVSVIGADLIGVKTPMDVSQNLTNKRIKIEKLSGRLTMKKTKGKLTISKVNSSIEGDYVNLRIRDDSSSASVVELKISLEEWAQACFSLGERPCQLTIPDNYDFFGKELETKREEIFIEDDILKRYGSKWDTKPEQRKVEMEYLLAPFINDLEVSGWKIERDDVFDNHRRRKNKDNGAVFSLALRRYV